MKLADNAYVSFMHSAHNKTVEGVWLGVEFNVWSINRLLGTRDKSNWKPVVDEQERKMNKETTANNEAFMRNLKKIDPAEYRELRTQDQQIAGVQKARNQYQENKGLDVYIKKVEELKAKRNSHQKSK